MLPEELRGRAVRSARKRGISLGEMVRESMSAYLEASQRKSPEDEDSFLSDCETFKRKTPKDVSAKHDRYLYGSDAP